MTDYTSQIDAWYNAIQYRNPPASELATFNAQLQSGVITTAQAIQQIEASPYTQNFVDPVIREYQAAFGRVPDQAGVAYWVGQVAANPASLAVLSTIFANSAEFIRELRGHRHDAGELHARRRALSERPRPPGRRRRPRLLVEPAARRRATAAGLRAIGGIRHRHHALYHHLSEPRGRRHRADHGFAV